MLKTVLASLGFGSKPVEQGGLSGADRDALRTMLAECDDLQLGLGAKVLGFVLTGEGESLLLGLRALPQGGTCLTGALAAEVWIYGGPDGRVLDKAASARNVPRIAARRRFLLDSESWDPAVLHRLGQVLAELNGRGQHSQHAGPGSVASPAWLRALVDCVSWCFLAHRRDRPAQAPRQLGILTADRCLEMLALDGAGTEVLIDCCFGADGYYAEQASRQMFQMGDLAAILAQGLPGVVVGLRRLPAASQAAAVAWLGEHVGLADPVLYDEVVALLTGGGKQVGAAALIALRRCDRARVHATGEALLAAKSPRERLAGIQILGRIIGRDAETLLRTQAAAETVRAVDQALKEALLAMEAGTVDEDGRTDDETGYRSADGAWVEVPGFDTLPDTPFPDGAADILRPAAIEAERLARARQAEMVAEMEQRRLDGNKYVHKVADYAGQFDPAGVDLVVRIADGRAVPGQAAPASYASSVMMSGSSYPYQEAAQAFAAAYGAVLARPGVTVRHLARLASATTAAHVTQAAGARDWARLFAGSRLPGLAGKAVKDQLDGGMDLRALLEAAGPWAPEPGHVVQLAMVEQLYGRSEDREDALVAALWPLVAQHVPLLDPVFGLAPWPLQGEPGTYHQLRGLDLLGLLPALPRRFLPAVLDMAMGGHPTLAPAARALLRPVKAATPMLLGMLTSSDAVRRQRAAALVARMGEAANIPALRTALAAERAEAVRAALLRALVALGDDISDQFSEATLLAQAKAGLKKTGAKLFEWFPLDALPAVTWADGRAVPPELVRWWLALSDKIKLPGGDPLMRMTLDRLDRTAAAKLGTLVMSAFIGQDTRMASAAEAATYAEANADALAKSYQRWNADFTREQAFEQLRRQKLGQYLGSANDHRGILALARHVPGPDAAQMVRAFFRDHYKRTAQCKAMLECLAGNPHPAALQVLLATANRYRTAGVQKHAAALVDQTAEENGWTRDELADRTVPTGGLDADGVLELPVGERVFRVLLDTAGGEFAITLTNPAGKAIKALPTLPEDATPEDKEELAAAKKAFTSLRKELKQTAEIQKSRLYEAMCAARIWMPEDFAAYLLRHPVMAPLCRRLVFAGVDAAGQVVGTVRPMEDGTLTGPADEAVTLDGFAGIRVAHRAILSADAAAAWATHLADYDVAPLFDQFGRPVVDLTALPADATEIVDRKGWMIETFKLRGVAGKLGYVRSQAEDGGFFTTYHKPFASLGLAARIEFTGAALPETSAPAALVSLSFVRAAGSGYSYKPLRLRELPPVLLNEAWNDLHKTAEAGTGFDAEWEKKARW